MTKKTILITGASGFIGKHLLNELNHEAYTIYALSRKPRVYSQVNVHPIIGDISEIENHPEIIDKIEYCIHIAGEKKTVAKMQKSNVDNLITMLSAFKTKNINFLHISSSGIYGIENYPEKVITEDKECYPNNEYENSKHEAENQLLAFAKKNKLAFSILRPSNVFGENDSQNKLLGLIKLIKGGKFFLINEKAMLNYVYVGQLTFTIKKFIDNNIFSGETYNVNSPTNIQYFTSLINKELGNKKDIRLFKGFAKKTILFCLNWLSKIGGFSKSKLREMTDEKYYSTNKLQGQIKVDEDMFVKTGISNLVNYYKSENLL
jgi:nucleoside-diphosphate-sugar epimerase